MENRELLQIAMRQSAIDLGCRAEDFLRTENVIVRSQSDPRARKYLDLPFSCNLVSYGNNIVASVGEVYAEIVENFLAKFEFYRCFETPALQILSDGLSSFGLRICFMAEYFLPDMGAMKELSCPFSLRILEKEQLATFYLPMWSNALSMEHRERDVFAVGAFDGDTLVGLAGCSADCDTMWQIGVDVLPQFRRRGIGSALVSRLALEILRRGKVPFYCAAWSNLRSKNTALKCGFRPAWVELTAKPAAYTQKLIDAMTKK